MGILTLLSLWVCGGDVHRLGDRDFGVRHQAHERLRSLGWVAYPSLVRHSQSPVPERAWRCAELAAELDAVFLTLLEIEAVARGDEPLPLGASDAYLRAVCRRVNKLGGWYMSDSWQYVYSRPYRDGTRRGECEHVVRVAASNRAARGVAEHLFPPLVPGLTK